MSEVISNDAEATAALMASLSGGTDEPAVEQAPAPVVEPVTTPVEPGTTDAPATDSFTSFDESALYATLPPEAKAIVDTAKKSFQSDYTRKTQELAEQRKAFEGLDPELARQSVEYVTRLSNDPEFLVSAYENIKEALTQMGYSEAEASQAAATQVTNDTPTYDDDDDDEVVPSRIQSELNELKAWKDNIEQERVQNYLANESLRQENIIRQEHPEYNEDDMSYIVQLGWSTGNDLIKAGKIYQDIQNHAARNLLNSKSSTPASISPAPANGSAIEPVKAFGSVEEAHAAALERLRQIAASE